MTIRQNLGIQKNPIKDSRKELLKKLHWLMFLRVVIITFLLGVTILIQLKQASSYLSPFLVYLYIVIITVYFLTFIYAFIINRIKNLPFFAYLQIILDVFLITFLIYSTGGKESVFTFMYTISIITASILLYRKGGILIASLCSILYGGLLDLEFYGIIYPVSIKVFEQKEYLTADMFYSIFINITAFYLVAFLSSLLSEQIRRSKIELQQKQLDFDQLEALNRNIIQSINSGLLTTDLEGNITFFNRAAEEITGYGYLQVYNSKVEYIFPCLIDSLNPNHSPSRFETEFKREDGVTLHLGFSISPLKDSSGEELGDILIFQDLTKLKSMEEHIRMVDRLAAVGRLAAGIAHEMRNPLASMSGSIQVLKDELQLDNGNKRLMEIAIKETERLNALITDFLLFAKPGLEEKEVVDIAKVIDYTLEEIIDNPEWNKDIEIHKNLPRDSKVEANTRQLKQVFWNLLMNAVQAMPEGGNLKIEVNKHKPEIINLKYMSTSQKAEDNLLEINIIDTGCGIAKKNLDKIFDPFFTTKEKGAGMGLAIAYRIIESYKGKILVKSNPLQGTTFTIYLPLVST
ncbi:MAG: ATP-binding protein [Pseudomonadota bacterium]